MREVVLEIQGLGVILYSPPAIAHIQHGEDYLQSHFTRPEDVARHVMDGQLVGFGTGSPGRFHMRFSDQLPNEEVLYSADFKLRLGLQVQGGVICVRDLYDLLQWTPVCPTDQQIPVSNGWYRLTVFSSAPSTGILGDEQIIDICFEPVVHRPELYWNGVPSLC